jgi:hypothetical protein
VYTVTFLKEVVHFSHRLRMRTGSQLIVGGRCRISFQKETVSFPRPQKKSHLQRIYRSLFILLLKLSAFLYSPMYSPEIRE